MKKNIFTVDDTERRRILEMHLNSTKKLYLNEQDEVQQAGNTTPVIGSTIGGVQIPGFLFAEDDKEWLVTKNKELNGKVTQQIISEENYDRLGRYYGITLPIADSSIDPSVFIGKYAIMFNSKPINNSLYKYEKGNVVDKTFKIGKVYKNENQTMILMTTGASASSGLNIRIPQKSTTSYLENFYLYDGNLNLNDYNNPYSNGAFGSIDINKTKPFKEEK